MDEILNDRNPSGDQRLLADLCETAVLRTNPTYARTIAALPKTASEAEPGERCRFCGIIYDGGEPVLVDGAGVQCERECIR